MAVRQLEWHAVEKVWGRRDFPSLYGDASEFEDPVGEIWFEDPHATELLVKYLFTSKKLSVQVHPCDEEAQAAGHARGKCEAWYVVSAEPGACIGAGLEKELTSAELRAASLDGSIEELMTWHEVKPGDFFYVPAGTVHAIGAGVSLLEIQQNVDLTYRLYDYGRPRSLQLDEGVAVSVPRPYQPAPMRTLSHTREVLVEGPKFVIERLGGSSQTEIRGSTDRPTWLVPVSNGCKVDGNEIHHGTVWLTDTSSQVHLGEGDCLLVAYSGNELI